MFGGNKLSKMYVWEHFGQNNELTLARFGFYFFLQEVGDDLGVCILSLQIA